MSDIFVKDPDSKLDYTVNWAAWLGTDTIASSAWVVPTGLTQVSVSSTTTTATIVISGGTAGQTYMITNRITTTQGRIDDRTAIIYIAPT